MAQSCFSRRDASKYILFDSKGQGQNLTSGHEVTLLRHVAYHPMRLDERNAMRPTRLSVSLFNQKLFEKKLLATRGSL